MTKNMIGFPPGVTTTRSGSTAGPRDVAGNRCAQLRQAGRRIVVGVALLERRRRGVDDVGRRIEVWLADLEMNDLAALCLERLCAGEHLKRCLGAEARHPAGQSHRSLPPSATSNQTPVILPRETFEW
jgi:hypothetical protein